MKKIIGLILTAFILLTVMPGLVMPVKAEAVIVPSGAYEISENGVYQLASDYSGVITVTSAVYEVTVTDAAYKAEHAETSIVIAGGRTRALELTIEDIDIDADIPETLPGEDRIGIDFSSAGDYEHRLYISGICNVTGGFSGKAGINVPEGVQLTIDRAESLNDYDTAQLTVIGGRYGAGIGGNLMESGGTINIINGTIIASSEGFAAGIGGGDGGSGGNISISGGEVTATGGSYGAAIGGGWAGTGGNITISGGKVRAIGTYGGAGIGGGRESYASLAGEGDGGNINICGGEVIATSGGPGAAIGGGWGGSAGTITISDGEVTATGFGGAGIGCGSEGTGGIIHISGGTVEATGGNGGAGIGGGSSGEVGTIIISGGTVTVEATGGNGGAGIGGGSNESGGTITIRGGTVTVTGGTYAAGIGGGHRGASGNITISDGIVTATGGVQGAGIGGGVEGSGENITISGGTVTAVSRFGGAGIGGGIDSETGGNITINGGTVIASCNRWGAGIGGGNGGDGGTIIINGGTIIANCGNGSYDEDGGNGGAGIGGGNGGEGGSITINGGTVTANGGWEGAGIGGGKLAAGGTVIIYDGTVEALGGGNGAGIGGGWAGAGGTVSIRGGTVKATGGYNSAGIGGGNGGAGADVTIINAPIVIAAGDVSAWEDYGAKHIGNGRGWEWLDLNPGTLKDVSGANLSYLRFNSSGIPDAKITLEGTEGSDGDYFTNDQGFFWMFVPYVESDTYSYTMKKVGYTSVRGKNVLFSVSHDISFEMEIDSTPPVIVRVTPVTTREANVFCNDYGAYGTLYLVPKTDADYLNKVDLDEVAEGRTFDLDSPQTTVKADTSGLNNGSYQFYAADSAGNISLPVNIILPFVIRSSSDNDSGRISSINTTTEGTAMKSNETTISVNALGRAAGKTTEVKTEHANVTLPSNMLTPEIVGNAKIVTLTIGAADIQKLPTEVQVQIGNRPVIELSLKLDGKAVSWDNPDAPVTVAIHYKPTAEELKNPENITVWYIDGAGNIVSVPSGRYDQKTGMVTFTTTHFSYYAVAYVQNTFSDLGSHAWAKKQIEVLAAKGIMKGRTENEFAPATGITRAEYIAALVRTIGVSAKPEDNFSDVRKDSSYYNEIAIAKKLGITNGTGSNSFKPETTISRQDMLVLTERALRSLNKLSSKGTISDLEQFTDRSKLADYAVGSIAALAKEGLIVGSNGKLNVCSDTTRAEAAVFLYRIYNK